MLKVAVPLAPNSLHWSAGSHFFLRFGGTGIHALTSHPFTASNVPSATVDGQDELLFHVKARSGVTARLAARARSGISMHSCWIDGPYGGLPDQYKSYDRIVVLVGGSGKHTHTLV